MSDLKVTQLDGEFWVSNTAQVTANQQVQVVEAEFVDSNNQVIQLETPEEKAANEDFIFSRDNLKKVIQQGADALTELVNIAKQSQHPRAFEVLATLLKVQAENNDRLLGLRKDRNELIEVAQPKGRNAPLVGNVVFVGSSTDLLKLLKKQ